MGIFSRQRPEASYPVTTLQRVLSDKDIIDITPERIITTDKGGMKFAAPDSRTVDFREFGTTGQSAYGSMYREEYNNDVRGLQGLRIYDKMRRNDAQIKMSLRLIKTPIRAARWYVDPASQSKRDVKIAEFVWDNLTKWMSMSFPQLIDETLFMLDFGWYSFEKVFAMQPDGDRVIWRKFAPRHPLDLYEWDWDANGGPTAMNFYGSQSDPLAIRIPIEKMLVCSFEKEGGNMEGVSLLRPAYKHWYYKENLYKIDAIQKERHGIGIPLIHLPPGYTADDQAAADEMGRNLRTNEKAHILAPPNWQIEFVELKGQPVDCMVSIAHHDMMIARNILAPFMNDNTQKDSDELFQKSTRYIAECIRDVFNKWAIPELVKYNWGANVEPPELKVRRIGETVDWRTLSFALRNLVGAEIMRPDEKLEAWIRDEMDLPRADPATVRETKAPQAGQSGPQPPVAGPPRQSTAKGMQVGPGSNAKVGVDKSGS